MHQEMCMTEFCSFDAVIVPKSNRALNRRASLQQHHCQSRSELDRKRTAQCNCRLVRAAAQSVRQLYMLARVVGVFSDLRDCASWLRRYPGRNICSS